MNAARARVRAVIALAVAVSLPPVTSSAQASGRMVVTPYAGVYTPANDIETMSASALGTFAALGARQKAGFAYGATASYWLTDRAAIELGAAYATSDLKYTGTLSEHGFSFAGTNAKQAHIILGSAKLMFQLLPSESRFNMRFGVGPAIVSRGGSAYEETVEQKFTGLTDFGAAMSLCTRIPVTSNVGVRLRAENYLYDAKIRVMDKLDPSNSMSFDSRVQNDLVFSAGLQLFLKR